MTQLLYFRDQRGHWHGIRLAEIGLQRISHWLNENLLTLNYDKTHFVTFSATQHGQPTENLLTVNISNSTAFTINRKPTIKYLGIILDSFLRWDHHIDNLCKKLRKTIYKFKMLRTFIDEKCMKMVYYSLVQSLLTYGIVGWGGTNYVHLDPLLKVQKLIMKIIKQKPPRYPSDQLYNEFGVMDARQLYSLEIICRLQKNPERFQHRNHSHNTRNRNLLITNVARKATYQRHFNHLAPKLHNLLPAHIKIIENPRKFKTAVKNWIVTTGRHHIENIISNNM